MKKLMFIAVMVLLACLNLLPEASGAFNPNWLPAQSKWLIHFNYSLFSQTQLHSIFDQNWKNEKNDFRAQILNEVNINIDKDLAGLTVVGLDLNGKKDNVMAIFQGRFDQENLIKVMEQKKVKIEKSMVGGVMVLKLESRGHLFFPAKDVMVFYEATAGIDEVVNLWKGRPKPISGASPLIRMLTEAPPNAFLRAAVTDVSRISKSAPKTMVFGSVSAAFFMALEAKDNLSLLLKLNTESEAKARNLQEVLVGIIALIRLKAAEKGNESSQILDLLNGFNFVVEGNQLRMNFDYPVSKIGKLIEGMSKNKTGEKWKGEKKY